MRWVALSVGVVMASSGRGGAQAPSSAKIDRALVSVVDPAKLDLRSLLRGRPADKIGVGVAQRARYGS